MELNCQFLLVSSSCGCGLCVGTKVQSWQPNFGDQTLGCLHIHCTWLSFAEKAHNFLIDKHKLKLLLFSLCMNLKNKGCTREFLRFEIGDVGCHPFP